MIGGSSSDSGTHRLTEQGLGGCCNQLAHDYSADDNNGWYQLNPSSQTVTINSLGTMASLTAATDLFELMMCWVCQALEAQAPVGNTCQSAIWRCEAQVWHTLRCNPQSVAVWCTTGLPSGSTQCSTLSCDMNKLLHFLTRRVWSRSWPKLCNWTGWLLHS